MYISVKASWIKTCGNERYMLGALSNGDYVVECIRVDEFIGRKDKMYIVRLNDGREWTIWNARGVTEHVDNPLTPFVDVEIIPRERNLAYATQCQNNAAHYAWEAMNTSNHDDQCYWQFMAKWEYSEARKVMCGAEHDINPADCGQ